MTPTLPPAENAPAEIAMPSPVRLRFGTLGWPLAALALLFTFNLFLTPGFFTLEIRDGRFYGVPYDILNRGAPVMLLSLGMALVIATGGVDLSVGAVMAMAGSIVAVLISRTENVFLAVLGALLCGLAAGLWNGVLVGVWRLQPIVATLVLMVAGRGIAQLITGGQVLNFSNAPLIFLGNGALFGLPVPFVIAIFAFAVTATLTRRTALGLFIETIGDNEIAARFAGLEARRIKLFVYTFSGACAAVAGVLGAANIRGADAIHAGLGLELDAILAAVVGGTALTGGRFSLGGAILGALLIQSLTTTLYMRDVSAEVAPLPKALVVLAVCLLQSPIFRSKMSGSLRRLWRKS